jgi:signal transduction histidine kinase
MILIILAVGIIPSVILTASILRTYEENAISQQTIEITSQAKILANQIISYDYFNNLNEDKINFQLEMLSNLYDGRVMVINDSFIVVKDTYGLDENKTVVSEEVIDCYNQTDISEFDRSNRYIEMAVPITNGETEAVYGILLISVSMDSILDISDYMQSNAVVVLIAIFVLVFVAALFGSKRLVKPFETLSRSIEEIQTDYDTNQLSVLDYEETRKLSEAFNHMMERMKNLDDSRQEFVSNVSHELKTPLTSMKVLADSLVGQENVPIELYEEFMTDIAQEIERENNIINDLLSLVKMDKANGVLNISIVNINELLELTLKRLRPVAEKQDVEVILESFRPVTAEIDEVKMTLVFTNLVENAIKYNNTGGWVHVTLNADYQFFYVKVEDNGIGIPEESLPHVFERFYRADKSHSREIGGTGLGLAITRNAVLMHRGAIKVDSRLGEGTTFTVRVPLNYIQ